MMNLTSILTNSKLRGLPLAMRSFRHLPPLPSAVMGVLAEQLNTGLTGAEMDEALKTTRQGMKYSYGCGLF